MTIGFLYYEGCMEGGKNDINLKKSFEYILEPLK